MESIDTSKVIRPDGSGRRISIFMALSVILIINGIYLVKNSDPVTDHGITNPKELQKKGKFTYQSKALTAKLDYKISPLFKEFGFSLKNMGQPPVFNNGKSVASPTNAEE